MSIKPGSPEWHRRVEALLIEEARQPMGLWYLSFAEPGKFNGGVFVEARGHTSALRESHRLGINPGGQVLHFPILPVVAFRIPQTLRNKLLTRLELDELDRTLQMTPSRTAN